MTLKTFSGTLQSSDGQEAEATVKVDIPEEQPPEPPNGGGGDLPPPTGDGSNAAPAGTPQYPDLLNNNAYVKKPDWKVAGVHYRVGPPAGQVFKDPATAELPAGVVRNVSGKTLTISGANVTLDGFKLDGWQILPNAAGFKLINSKGIANRPFTNSGMIHASRPAARNMVIEYCDLDGGSKLDPKTPLSAIVYTDGEGDFTVQYCHLKNSVSDLLDMGLNPAYNGQQHPVLRYNVWEDVGCAPGAHGDTTQWQCKQVVNLDVSYNTVIYNFVGSGPQGIQMQAQQGGRFDDNSRVHHNVLIAGPGLQGKTMSYAIAYVGTSGEASDNFMDIMSAWGAFYSRPRICERNYNMRTGRVINADNSER